MKEQHPGDDNLLFKIVNPTTHNTHAHNPIQVSTTQPLQNEPTQITTQDTQQHNTSMSQYIATTISDIIFMIPALL